MAAQGATRSARRLMEQLGERVGQLGSISYDLGDWIWTRLQELASAPAATAADLGPAVATILLGAAVLWLAWRLLRPQTAREVVEEYEEEMQVHVVWLDDHPLLAAGEAKVTGLTRSKVLAAAPRLELPNPDGMGRSAMEQVEQLRDDVATFKGSAGECGLMMWREFLLPMVLEARVMNEVLDDIRAATDVLVSRRHELRCLFCLLWSVVMPCTPSPQCKGSALWLTERNHQSSDIDLQSRDYDVIDDHQAAEAQEESQSMFFEQIARLMRVILPLSNKVLGIRDQDRPVMFRAFKDFILLVRHALGGRRLVENVDRSERAAGSASFSDRARFAEPPEKRAKSEPWLYFELEDKGSPFYIGGLEDVEGTPGLLASLGRDGTAAVDDGSDSDDPEPEEEKQ
jgi:hypothetical protein